MSGKEMMDRMIAQCKKAGAEIRQYEKVVGLSAKDEKPIVKTEKSDFSAAAIIIRLPSRQRLIALTPPTA